MCLCIACDLINTQPISLGGPAPVGLKKHLENQQNSSPSFGAC